MCKHFMLTNTSLLKPNQLARLLQVSAKILGKTDNHGFGWVMRNAQTGRFVGERCIDPRYFENRFFNGNAIPKNYKGLFEEETESNHFGKMPQVYSGGLLIHARISTNEKGLVNTHPFTNDEWALTHNGIVYNEGQPVTRVSSNDTEFLLHYLTQSGVSGMVDNVSGYYAVGALSRQNGNMLVIKDTTANLYACYVGAINSMAFATSDEQLGAILKAMNLTHSQILTVKDDMSYCFDVKGNLVTETAIKPIKKIYSNAAYYESMGWDYPIDYDRSGDYNSRSTSNFKDLVKAEQKAINDVPHSQEALEVARSIGHLDFIDENGEVIPTDKLDSLFIFIDYRGEEISAMTYLGLDDDEQEFCEVYNRQTHEPVGKLAS